MPIVVNALLPPNTNRRLVVGQIARKLRILGRKHPDIHFAEWAERSEPFSWSEPRKLNYQPLISIVVPIYNSPSKYLMPMVYSVVNQQHYDNWELILVNASSDQKRIQDTKQCQEIDNRIKVLEVPRNLGIAGNTNFGIEHSNGEYIGLLDHDDTLAPKALYEVGVTLQETPRPQLIYSDEDKISENGEYRYDPFFKPDWSPFLLRHVNYLNHFSLIHRQLIIDVGGYREDFEGAQDYDLFLRLIDEQPIISHIPKILYHWRSAIGSTARNFESKKNIRDAGILALEQHLARNNQKGRVSHLIKQPGFYRISYRIKKDERVALVILPSIVREQYKNFVNKIVSNTEFPSSKTDLIIYGESDGYENPELETHQISDKNSSGFIQKALDSTKADTFVIIATAFTPLKPSWLLQLTGLVSEVDDVAVASPLFIDKAGGMIYDGGFVDLDGRLVSLFDWLGVESNTYLGNTVWGRNLDQTSNRINVMRREVLEEYFTDYPKINGGRQIFKSIIRDGKQVVVDVSVKVDFNGDLNPPAQKTIYFNPSLIDTRRGISLPKTINVPPEAK